ncbi:hypothetical protein K1719_003136 [Acacia pycnantha]|nr:hypothetical protein K1719_003136 [Acacia pycnantha]
MDQMVADFNKIQTSKRQNMGFTENNSPTFISSGDPCLDFFFHIVPDTPSSSLTHRLQLAWSHNPLTTLKLVCNLRGVRRTGKSDKEGFYCAALWLYTNHPRTLAINVPSFADFGYFKDLPEILYRILEDAEFLKRGELRRISLAAKWCPSIDSSFDRSTLLCESIARRIFPRESYQEYQELEEAHYAYRIRDRLRKEIMVPLRKVLELPEVYIGANQWGLIPYNRVASVAMKFYTEKFMMHDGQRFMEYLSDVKAGKATIAAGALLPHEIIR